MAPEKSEPFFVGMTQERNPHEMSLREIREAQAPWRRLPLRPENSPKQAEAKRVSERTIKDEVTGKKYKARDAAFDPAFTANKRGNLR